jgi:hypothetical protein
LPETKELPLLSVIIVHYKNDNVLHQCLLSFAKGISRHSWELILVRNDGIKDNHALSSHPCLKASVLSIIVNQNNLGFSKACNQGAKQARGKFLLFLNPDTVLSDDSISKLIDFYETKDDCGIAGPTILNADGSVQGSARSFPGFRTAFFGRTSLLTRLFPSNRFTRSEFKKEVKRKGLETHDCAIVDWVSGAAILVSASLFKELKGFDDQFFMYWEDADLCFRLARTNHKAYYYKPSIIYHNAGSCSKDNQTKTTIEFHKSVYRYYCKNINPGQTAGAKISRFIIAAGITGRCAVKLLLSSIGLS